MNIQYLPIYPIPIYWQYKTYLQEAFTDLLTLTKIMGTSAYDVTRHPNIFEILILIFIYMKKKTKI